MVRLRYPSPGYSLEGILGHHRFLSLERPADPAAGYEAIAEGEWIEAFLLPDFWQRSPRWKPAGGGQ
jgi:hypothetical protein